jgi:hypothetical protein
MITLAASFASHILPHVSAWHDCKYALSAVATVAAAVHCGSSIGPSLVFTGLEM